MLDAVNTNTNVIAGKALLLGPMDKPVMVLWSDLPFYDFLAVDARRYGCKMSFVDQGRVQAQWVNKTIPVLCEYISKFVSSAFPLVICLCPRGASVFAGWLSRELPVPALCSYFVHPSCNHSATPVSSTCWLEVTEESTHTAWPEWLSGTRCRSVAPGLPLRRIVNASLKLQQTKDQSNCVSIY